MIGLQLAEVWIASSVAILLVCPGLRRLAIGMIGASIGFLRNRQAKTLT